MNKYVLRLAQKSYLQLRKIEPVYHILLKAKFKFDKEFSINSFPLIGMKEFCVKYNQEYHKMESSQERIVFQPYFWGRNECEKEYSISSPEVYIAELEDAVVIGGNSFVLSNHYCIYDIACRPNAERYDLRAGAIRFCNGKKVTLVNAKTNRKIHNAISLLGLASDNYYHFYIEILPRLQYVFRNEKYKSLPILLDQATLNNPAFRDLLDSLVNGRHEIIGIDANESCMVEKLVFPSYLTWMPINLKEGIHMMPEDFMMAQSGLEFLRDNLKESLQPKAAKKKIFISRINTVNSRLVNEKEVADLFKSYGFEIICPELFSSLEQRQIFFDAQVVVGATGAAFSNMVLCQPHTLIVNVIPQKYHFFGYSTMAHLLNHRVCFLDAKVYKEEVYSAMERYVLDLDECKAFLEQLEKDALTEVSNG